MNVAVSAHSRERSGGVVVEGAHAYEMKDGVTRTAVAAHAIGRVDVGPVPAVQRVAEGRAIEPQPRAQHRSATDGVAVASAKTSRRNADDAENNEATNCGAKRRR